MQKAYTFDRNIIRPRSLVIVNDWIILLISKTLVFGKPKNFSMVISCLVFKRLGEL